MKQRTLAAQSGFERYTKKTRRAEFLEEMERVVPWAELCALIEPVYPKAGQGRPPVGVERMLRLYFLQQWFNLSDPAVEEALYESVSLRAFVDIDLGREPVPDETTICKFRHLLEEHGLGGEMLETVNLHLEGKVTEVCRRCVARREVAYRGARVIHTIDIITRTSRARIVTPPIIIWTLQWIVQARRATRCLHIDVL